MKYFVFIDSNRTVGQCSDHSFFLSPFSARKLCKKHPRVQRLSFFNCPWYTLLASETVSDNIPRQPEKGRKPVSGSKWPLKTKLPPLLFSHHRGAFKSLGSQKLIDKGENNFDLCTSANSSTLNLDRLGYWFVSFWISLDLFRSRMNHFSLLGSIWINLDVFGGIWRHLDTFGYI